MADMQGRGSDMEGPHAPSAALQLMINSLEKPLSRYPTQEDAAFARQQGFDYAHPHKEFLDEKAGNIYKPTTLDAFIQQSRTGKPEIPNMTMTSPSPFSTGDAHMRAALAAKRSALAQLGIDPANTVMDFSDRRRYANGGPIGGSYIPMTGQTYVRATDMPGGDADPASSIVHEAIHRGTHKLAQSPYWKPEWDDLAVSDKALKHNEYLVRWLMQNKMGDPEWGGPEGSLPDTQKKTAASLFKIPSYQKKLEGMEAAAAQMLKDQNPRGPR